MPQIPDLTEPRYLDESGRFFYKEKYRRGQFCGFHLYQKLEPRVRRQWKFPNN
jgi:hypothetical protein